MGEPTFVGSTGQVFPASLRATPLLRAWLVRLASLNVRMRVRHRWLGWSEADDGVADPRRSLFFGPNGDDVEIASDVTVLALGGASWPRSVRTEHGSTHCAEHRSRLIELRPANCGMHVDWSQHLPTGLPGIPLKNVAMDVAGVSVRGDAMVSHPHRGGSVYTHAAVLRDTIDRDGQCTMVIDLHPDIDVDRLLARLQRAPPKDSVTTLLRRTIGLTPCFDLTAARGHRQSGSDGSGTRWPIW